MAKMAMVALLTVALGGCAMMQGEKSTKPEPPAKGTTLTSVSGAGFQPGKARLTDEARMQVSEAVYVLQKYPELKVSVEGHTDSKGGPKFNQQLSERRARAVAEMLVEQGIASKRVSWKGFGETKSIADNKTEDGRAKNRRVEIVVQ
jgi:outer membrane protein OmpA-like peptidoglycan-associated protein